MANSMDAHSRARTVQPTTFKPMQFNFFLFCVLVLFEFYFVFTVIVIAELVILFIEFLKYLLFNVIYPPNMFMCCRYSFVFVFIWIWQSIYLVYSIALTHTLPFYCARIFSLFARRKFIFIAFD